MMTNTWAYRQKKPIKEMRQLPLILNGSKLIRDDIGLTFYSITGNQQSGKSAYGMCILSELYGFNEDAVLNQICMTAKQFTEKIDDALKKKYRHKCIMWDDMSVTGSAANWMTDPKMVMYLAALGDTLAIATKGIIMTSPSGDMTKAFRNYEKYIVQIKEGRSKSYRRARAFFIGKSPMSQFYIQPTFEDEFRVKIPFYERYAKMREELSIKAVRDMKEMFNTAVEPSRDELPLSKRFGKVEINNLYETEGTWVGVARIISNIIGKSITPEACRKIVRC